LFEIKNNINKEEKKTRRGEKDEITKKEIIIFLSLKHDCGQEPNKQTLVACKKKQNIRYEFCLSIMLMSNFHYFT
jgi:hypothetical protein